MRTSKWAVGMRKLAPGCYVDKKEVLHIDEAALCAEAHVSYTRQNAEMLRKGAAEMLGIQVEEVED